MPPFIWGLPSDEFPPTLATRAVESAQSLIPLTEIWQYDFQTVLHLVAVIERVRTSVRARC